MKLLHVDSSITGENSVSRQLSASVTDRLVATDPSITIVYRDLVAQPLDHLDLAALPGDCGEAAIASNAVLEEFLAASIVVIGAPMYNFTIPTQLKAWLDRVLIANRTFRYTAEGPVGLAGDKRVVITISRGGFYGPGTPTTTAEHTLNYLTTAFGFIGITPEFIVAEGIAIGPEQRAQAIEAATGDIAQLVA